MYGAEIAFIKGADHREAQKQKTGMGEEREVKIVMLPWLAHGHSNPFINLSKSLATHGAVKLWILSSPVNISRIKARLNGEPIHLVELPMPSVDGLPPGVENTADIKPESVHLLHCAFDQLEKPFESILKRLSPDFIVYDLVAPWAATVAAHLEIPSFAFSVYSPAAIAYFLGHAKRAASGGEVRAEDLTQAPSDYPFSLISWRPFEARLGLSNFIAIGGRVWECCQRSCGIVIKSCFEEEEKYLRYLAFLAGKPVISVGPLMLPEAQTDTSREDYVIDFLEKQVASSVVFISFGSESFLLEKQIWELAMAVEETGLPFLWSLRSSDGTSSALSLLPEGFERRTCERGVVVDGWVPQLRIVSHPSVGSYVTHGGWSSVMEAWLFSALPLVLIPLRHDQGLNSRQIAQEFKAGIEVERNEDGDFRREDVFEAVLMVMGNEEIRLRVRELRSAIELKAESQEYMGMLVNHMKKYAISHKIENV